MLKTLVLIAALLTPLTAGYYSAPSSVTASTVTVSIQNSPIKTTSRVKTLTDTAVSMLIFGGWAGTCCRGAIFSMGPNAGKGGTIGQWVDTLRYVRLYAKYPPAYVIGNTIRIERQDNWADTTLLIGYQNDGVIFSFSRSGVLEFVKDSTYPIFRVIDDNNQEVFIVARYAGLVDSMKIVTGKHPWCIPWPDCYYNPQKPVIPELPRIYLDDMVAEARAATNSPATDTILFLENMQMMCCGECNDSTQNYASCQRTRILPSGDTITINRDGWFQCCGKCADTTQNYMTCNRSNLKSNPPKVIAPKLSRFRRYYTLWWKV